MTGQSCMTPPSATNSGRVRSKMKVKLISFTKTGGILCRRLQRELNLLDFEAEGCCKYAVPGLKLLTETIGTYTKRAFDNGEAMVFIGAAGIAVRAVAPNIRAKDCDPPVLVIDEKGKYVIPILSGHLGGANRLAVGMARILSAEPVITTATDIGEKFAVDVWAQDIGCHIANVENIRHISAAVLREEVIGLYSEFPVEGQVPAFLCESDKPAAGICISAGYKKCFTHTLYLIPRQYVLGIGCRKDTPYEDMLAFVNSLLERQGIQPFQLCAVASIDLKAREKALLRLSKYFKVPFCTFSSQELSQVPGCFTKSDFVEKTTGVDNVCERAAVKAGNGRLVTGKCSHRGITAAIAINEWRCRFENTTGIFGS